MNARLKSVFRILLKWWEFLFKYFMVGFMLWCAMDSHRFESKVGFWWAAGYFAMCVYCSGYWLFSALKTKAPWKEW